MSNQDPWSRRSLSAGLFIQIVGGIIAAVITAWILSYSFSNSYSNSPQQGSISAPTVSLVSPTEIASSNVSSQNKPEISTNIPVFYVILGIFGILGLFYPF